MAASRMDGSTLAASQWREAMALIVALGYPTLLTWLYFVALNDAPARVQQATYALGKAVQFGLPAFWVWVVCREARLRPWPGKRGLGAGLASGVLVAGLLVGLYAGWFRSTPLPDAVAPAVRAKLLGLGVDSPSRFLLLAVFYSVVHSGLEEYYWRWFIFGRLRLLVEWRLAVWVSALGFMSHHVLVLGMYFGWGSVTSLALSLGVAAAGAFWAWLYQRTGSLTAPWLSHLWADAAIFGVGYHLVRSSV